MSLLVMIEEALAGFRNETLFFGQPMSLHLHSIYLRPSRTAPLTYFPRTSLKLEDKTQTRPHVGGDTVGAPDEFDVAGTLFCGRAVVVNYFEDKTGNVCLSTFLVTE